MITVGTAIGGAVTALQAAGAVQDFLRSARGDSLVEYTRTTRVEPIVFVDEGLVHLDYMPNIMQSLSAIFAGYYLQAVNISINVGKINTIKLLDRLNPNRDPLLAASGVIEAGLKGIQVSTASYLYGLPFHGLSTGLEAYGSDAKRVVDIVGTPTVSVEALKVSGYNSDKGSAHVAGTIIDGVVGGAHDSNARSDAAYGKASEHNIESLQEDINLSVGRLLEVAVQDGDHKAVIPVSVRLMAAPMSSDDLVHILTVAKKDTSGKERYHGWRSGSLSFIKDLIFCQDLIDEHRKNLMADATGQYKNTLARSNKNALAAIVSGRLSLANASNMIVFKNTTASKVEAALGGRFKDFAFREAIFKKTYAMLMVVVDTDWERVTVYTRSIETPTQHSIKEMKNAGGKKDIDVGEILAAYKMGSAPTI